MWHVLSKLFQFQDHQSKAHKYAFTLAKWITKQKNFKFRLRHNELFFKSHHPQDLESGEQQSSDHVMIWHKFPHQHSNTKKQNNKTEYVSQQKFWTQQTIQHYNKLTTKLVRDNQRSCVVDIDSTVDTLTKVLLQAAMRPKLSSKSTKTTKRDVTEMHLVGMTNAKKSKDRVKPFQPNQQNSRKNNKTTAITPTKSNCCIERNQIHKTHKRNWSSKKRQLVHLSLTNGRKKMQKSTHSQCRIGVGWIQNNPNSTKNKQKQSITPQVTIQMEGKDATLDPREKEDLLAEQHRKVSVVHKLPPSTQSRVLDHFGSQTILWTMCS